MKRQRELVTACHTPVLYFISKPDLCALSAKAQGCLASVAENAASAYAALDVLRDDALSVVVDDGDLGSETVRRTIEMRCEDIATLISISKNTKTSSIERELVAIDAALEEMQDAKGNIDALQESLFTQFGPLPLEPAELSTMHLVKGDTMSVATLCAPRGLASSDVSISDVPISYYLSRKAPKLLCQSYRMLSS